MEYYLQPSSAAWSVSHKSRSHGYKVRTNRQLPSILIKYCVIFMLTYYSTKLVPTSSEVMVSIDENRSRMGAKQLFHVYFISIALIYKVRTNLPVSSYIVSLTSWLTMALFRCLVGFIILAAVRYANYTSVLFD